MKYHFHTSCYDFALSQETLELNMNSEHPTIVKQVLRVKLGNFRVTQLMGQHDAYKAFQLHMHDRDTNGVS
jgi:hypothetical protein